MQQKSHKTGRRANPEELLLPLSEMAILEVVPEAMVIADEAGAICFVNAQTVAMFGYLRSELLEMKLDALMPERFRGKHQHHRREFISRPAIRPMGSGLKLFGLKKDGTEFPLDISLGPFKRGDQILAIAAIRDISELREASEKLHKKIRELADFKSALDEHAILAITDACGRITYANDKFCKISQYSRAELLGQDHRLINSGHHSKEFWRRAWATLIGGDVWKAEVKNRAKDGSFYWVDATIVPFLDDEGKPVQFLAIRTEITDRKKAEEERELLIRELRDALAEVKVLSGLLPICCSCKKVRDDKGYWNQLETYISKHSDASFSHGYCPDCVVQVYENSGLPVPDKYLKGDAEV
jgi:PAS domain S-box-containing protein